MYLSFFVYLCFCLCLCLFISVPSTRSVSLDLCVSVRTLKKSNSFLSHETGFDYRYVNVLYYTRNRTRTRIQPIAHTHTHNSAYFNLFLSRHKLNLCTFWWKLYYYFFFLLLHIFVRVVFVVVVDCNLLYEEKKTWIGSFFMDIWKEIHTLNRTITCLQ